PRVSPSTCRQKRVANPAPTKKSPSTPCIRCGWCIENCPARLNVAALNDDFELARPKRAQRRRVLACVDCGICSYLCPARLPLTRRVGLLKRAVRRSQDKAKHVEQPR
ncbi:hypothetical protein LCGC14_2025130, partial [marine sediment metagenome]